MTSETDESGEKVRAIQNIIGMLPGMGQIKDQLKDLDLNSKEVRRIEAIIKSMTAAERQDPNILNWFSSQAYCDGVRYTSTRRQSLINNSKKRGR